MQRVNVIFFFLTFEERRNKILC